LLPKSSLAQTTFVPSRKAESQLPLGGTSVIARPAQAPAFPDLCALGRIEAERQVNGKSTQTVLYVALSKRLTPRRLLEVTRRH
jgi:hypothetical protein